jgi:hypothetical protein
MVVAVPFGRRNKLIASWTRTGGLRSAYRTGRATCLAGAMTSQEPAASGSRACLARRVAAAQSRGAAAGRRRRQGPLPGLALLARAGVTHRADA